MTLDQQLDALRALMQQDIGARGLSGEMFAACAGDLAAACRELAGVATPPPNPLPGIEVGGPSASSPTPPRAERGDRKGIASAEGGSTQPQEAERFKGGVHIPAGEAMLLRPPSPFRRGGAGGGEVAPVGIVTGFHIPSAGRFETDGPPGAVFLARALHACGIPAVLICDRACGDALSAGLDEYRLTADILALPCDLPARHLVAIERVGPAADGRCYTMRGIDITEKMADVEPYFRGVRSVGIGDGGNEVGMGKLPPGVIARNIPGGAKIACRVATDHLLVAGISNWGAWALGLGVCLVRGVTLDIDIEQEYRVLGRMIHEGQLVDGVTGRAEHSVDGVPFGLYIQPLIEMKKVADT